MEKKNSLKRKDAFFGLHLDLHPTAEDTALGADISEENMIRLLERVRPEHITYDCKGHPGYLGYPGKEGTPSPGIVKDSLALWRKVTKDRGVLLGIHYSGVWDFLAVKQQPQWAAVDENGNRDPQATSVFSPYVDELLLPQLKEIYRLYGVDSMWLDGECWETRLDYCAGALEAWTDETGVGDAPRNRTEDRWLEWKMFHRRRFEQYLCHWVDEMHKMDKELQVASNWAYSTMMPKKVEAGVDFISGDFDPFLSVDRARTETRFLSNVGLPWELQSWGFDLVQDQDECLKLPEHLKQEAGVVLMHGGGYMLYFLPTRSGYINGTIIHTAGEVADFCHVRKETCFGSTSVPQVALLHSAETQFYKSDRVFTWWDTPLHELEGALHALLELHYSVDVLAEHMLVPRLKEFPVVVIPDSCRLGQDFIKALMYYVHNGGNLLLLGNQCAKYFQPYLGVTFVGEPEEVNATLNTSRGKVSARGKWQEVEVTWAEILAYRYRAEGQQNRSSYMDVRDQGVSGEHSAHVFKEVAATLCNYGKGRIGAVYGPVPEIYFNNHHPFTRDFIGCITAKLFPDPAVKVKAPAYVDISLRTTKKGLLSLHLLNLSNMPVSQRRAFAEEIPSVHSIEIELHVAQKPCKVLWEPYGEELAWSWNKGILKAVVPELHIHGAVVVS